MNTNGQYTDRYITFQFPDGYEKSIKFKSPGTWETTTKPSRFIRIYIASYEAEKIPGIPRSSTFDEVCELYSRFNGMNGVSIPIMKLPFASMLYCYTPGTYIASVLSYEKYMMDVQIGCSKWDYNIAPFLPFFESITLNYEEFVKQEHDVMVKRHEKIKKRITRLRKEKGEPDLINFTKDDMLLLAAWSLKFDEERR
jgi:hypothetical protein